MAGFLVFLIALPLCLAIANASGFPPVAGVFTAIVGGVVTPWLSNSELTIKGPAAGMIVIVMGAMQQFGYTGGQNPAADSQAYRWALAVGVVAGVAQVALGLFRSGVLGELFPSATVHGMLAAIGVIIIAKQVPVALGVAAQGEPLELLAEIPREILEMNPEIALIGFVSLAVLFAVPWLRHPMVRRIPAPMLVLLLAVPLGMHFDLSHEHTYSLLGHSYSISERFLVNVPARLLGAITYPDFSILKTPAAWTWVLMYTLIGTLESVLSAKAIDLLDPKRRKTNLNRDLVAIGVANTLAACIGGLPMISEIVRSRANIDNGAKSRLANGFHAVFLLLALLALPALIHRIPMAALGAMLVYTGFRLASPREFWHVYQIGREQLVIFVTTIVGVLATDLLVGILIGMGMKLLIHFINGAPLTALFRPYLEAEPIDGRTTLVHARRAVVFSNWIFVKRQLENLGLRDERNLVVDFAEASLVDHTVMEKLYDLEREFRGRGLSLDLVGLDGHVPFSDHPRAGRRKHISIGQNGSHAAPALRC